MGLSLVLTDNTLLGFSRDGRFRQALPVFDRVFRAIGTSGGCRCRSKHGSLGPMLAALKQMLPRDAGMIAKIKALTGATSIIVHIREGANVVRKEL